MLNLDGSLASSKQRITGIYSGIDTDSVISNMMKIQQLKVDRALKSKIKLEWQRDGYKEMSAALKNFKNEFMSMLNSSKMMFSSTAMNNFKASVTGTNSASISVTAGVYASEKSFSVTAAKMATAASASSGGEIAKDSNGLNQNLSLNALAAGEDGTNQYVNNGLKLSDNGNFEFSINGKSFSFKGTTSVRTMISEVNASDAGVKMSYSSITNSFAFEAKTTGAASSLEVANAGESNAFGPGGFFGIDSSSVNAGTDGSLTVVEKGVTKTFTSSSNTFNFDGVSVSIKNDIAAGSDPLSVNVERDIDASVNKIKGFVEGLNKLLKDFYGKVGEEKFKGFDPLTDTERKALSEKEAEQWDAKAKSGLFRNDSELNRLVSSIRSAVTEGMTHAETGFSLSSVGISFGSYFTGDKNSVVIDEEKLRKALEQNPDAVNSLFFNSSPSVDKDTPTSELGLSQRMERIINSFSDKFSDVNVKNLDKSIKDSGESLEQLIKKLNAKEEALYAQFAAMEQAISKYQSQGNWLSSAMGSM